MNAEQSPPMPAPDSETVSRAVLTAAINGADALMFATLKGSDSAEALAATLMSAARHDNRSPNRPQCAGWLLRHRSEPIGPQGAARGHAGVPYGIKRMDPPATHAPRLLHGRAGRADDGRRRDVDHRPAQPVLAPSAGRPRHPQGLGAAPVPVGPGRPRIAGLLRQPAGDRGVTGGRRLRVHRGAGVGRAGRGGRSSGGFRRRHGHRRRGASGCPGRRTTGFRRHDSPGTYGRGIRRWAASHRAATQTVASSRGCGGRAGR